ncbi:glycosyltransferase family 2 protein [Meiothermus hypogaeus]|uniref:UDP-Glc:alpha-D-GlcNAc-diphosphoundecaprenol beta-1,3-glucosyltransferase WfgD n=2 Tax=Meiothermus hypogaeus TaxID=884155 RepID=A0ABX9MR80_9DEIN|nr:glycosyltransferase family 2 protein [Meiothermus hypogaeus]RIH80894.1 UDP-Glc:alpha-D-GlcNAc-diphosphoundecaprenol beta-1,3-glucosyltransferase WfgD [Meiothermus hypogaeus]GEM82969.1 putative glycosyltransferase YwdF [Meiothermus hypogaeus NBRC 106114]GIW37101.1 MAG: putative glycosyltransferase YwdF [Meiothermus sp.]
MVSVLIPTYNRPQLLLRALRSLQLQLYPDWEAVVIDDGDGAGVLAAHSLRDPRILGVRNEGRGQVHARNTGLAHATGSIIALLDDDDWWLDPTHLHRVVRALKAQAGLVYRGGYLVVERDGLELERIPFDFKASPLSLRTDNHLLATGAAYPRFFHDELGPFDPEVADYWDWDWYLRVVSAGYPLIQLPGRGVAVAMHGGNMSYAARQGERQKNLDKLASKHGLGNLQLKDHRIIAGAA